MLLCAGMLATSKEDAAELWLLPVDLAFLFGLPFLACGLFCRFAQDSAMRSEWLFVGFVLSALYSEHIMRE